MYNFNNVVYRRSPMPSEAENQGTRTRRFVALCILVSSIILAAVVFVNSEITDRNVNQKSLQPCTKETAK